VLASPAVRPTSFDDPTQVDGGGVVTGAATVTGPTTVAQVDPARLRADEALTIATDFDQRYRLGDELARGGLARIRDAYDRVLHRRVAVKQLLHRAPGADVRFLREARITGRLAHPNIVPIYDLGLDPEGAPFYAMKWVEGRSLHDLIDERATLDERLALLPHVIAIADALAYAHAVGVIHRDLKPANVLVGAYGETIVIDWGLALERDGADLPAAPAEPVSAPRLTSVGAVIGTPAYMPPEQARGERVGPAADIYALGATLYHVIAGVYPYEELGAPAGSSDPVWVRVIDAPPTPLAQLCPEVPPELAAIVERAMARRPEARFPTASALGAALTAFVTHQQSHRLAAAAIARDAGVAAETRAVKTDDAAAVAAIYREAAVVQFGLEQALAAWPDNPAAKAALTRLHARMFDFECAVGNLAAAAARAEALPPDPDRARMLAALRDDLARRDAEAEAFVRDRDRSVGGKERGLMLGAIGLILTYFLVEAFVSGRSLDDPGAGGRILRNACVVAAPALAMMAIWRKRMFANEFSRRAGRAVVAMFAATIAHRALALQIDQPARSVFVLDLLLVTVSMATFGGRLGLGLATVGLAGAIVCAFVPAAALLVYNGAIIAVAAILAVSWSRASRRGR
jgi:hypothetical protein